MSEFTDPIELLQQAVTKRDQMMKSIDQQVAEAEGKLKTLQAQREAIKRETEGYRLAIAILQAKADPSVPGK